MENAIVNLPVEDIQERGAATSGTGVALSSSWYYFWFTNPPAALAGRFGCSREE
jgi:hypothetical protein